MEVRSQAPSEEGTPVTAPTRQRRSGRSLMSFALPIIGLATIGLVVAAGVLYASLIQSPNEQAQARYSSAEADGYAGLIQSRIDGLRGQLSSAAQAPRVTAAIAGDDAGIREALAGELTTLIPYAERVDLLPVGTARPDRNATVPISYAALEVIQRAETEPYVLEGVKLDNQSVRYHAAVPVMNDGRVAGVLFVALSGDYLLAPLRAFDAASPQPGRVTLQQAFEGVERVALVQWGAASGNLAVGVRRELGLTHWQLNYEPAEAALPVVARPVSLLTALAMALGLMLGGVLLAFSSLNRRLRQDAEGLVEQTSSAMRNQRVQPHRYRIAAFADLAREVGRIIRPPESPRRSAAAMPQAGTAGQSRAAAQAPAAGNADGKSESSEVDDLLRDEPAPAKDKRPATSEDFLEVSEAGDARDNFGIEVTEDTSPVALGLDLQAEIFRSYDIRGITTENLTEEVVYWIGRAFAAEAIDHGNSTVAVGRDGRHSSAPLRDALARGLTEGGANVLDVGQVPTPVLYFATHVLETGTGIMITGSHNPPEYNGLKMMIGGVTLAEERIQALRERIEDNRLSDGDGSIESVDVASRYIERIVDDVVVAQPLKVVVDCGNGVAGELAPALLSRLGCEVVPLYCDIDGDFPNHHPDPAEPHNLEDLITVVAAEGADLGLAFDGDGDRLGVVTASGEIIWPDKLLMLYAQDIVGRNPGADIIYDVKCSRHLNTVIGNLGGRPIMWKTGHSHMKAKLKETGALLAGEFSGHICFGERWYGFDDALYSAARLLEILGAGDQTADEVFAQFPITCSTPELKIKTSEKAKFEILEKLAANGDFGDGTITTIDGLRVDYADGWGLIRPSNTSPVLSLRFEADSADALERIQDVFQARLDAIDPALRFRA